jgi:hypothetical protein
MALEIGPFLFAAHEFPRAALAARLAEATFDKLSQHTRLTYNEN